MSLVIIGGSFAGRMVTQTVLNQLGPDYRENVEITIVDKSSHFEYICTNYKSLCDDDSFEYLTVEHAKAIDSLNRDLLGDSEYKPVKFVQGLLSSVEHAKNVVIIEKIEGAN